jgi:exopolyphosphatase/guanosine-5'-triphosphate,3'-diphosphate pyrophosphatase
LCRSSTSIAYSPTGSDYANLPSLPLACVDIGSNTTRLLVADVVNDRLRELAAVREFTLIGSSVAEDGSISPEKIVETAEAVAAQVSTALRLGAKLIAVVGTAVLRAAPNADDLGAEVERRTGFPLRVLSEAAEAELSFLGATTVSAPDVAGSVAVADIGGGSSELSVGRCGEKPGWWHSIALGSARLARTFLDDDPPSPEQLAACRAHAAEAVAMLDPPEVEHALAVGGSATSMRLLAGPLLDDRALERALHLLQHHPAADVARDHEIDVRRVRLLPAGIAILAAVSARLGLPLHVARGGLREGVVLRLAESQA